MQGEPDLQYQQTPLQAYSGSNGPAAAAQQLCNSGGEPLSEADARCCEALEQRWRSIAGCGLRGLAPREFPPPAHEPNPFG